MPTKPPNVNPSIWAEDGNLHISGVHTIKMASMMVNSLAPTKSLTTYTTSVRDWYSVDPSIWAEDGNLHVSGVHTVKMASMMVNSLAPTKSLTTYTTSVQDRYSVNPSIWAGNGNLHISGVHTVKIASNHPLPVDGTAFSKKNIQLDRLGKKARCIT